MQGILFPKVVFLHQVLAEWDVLHSSLTALASSSATCCLFITVCHRQVLIYSTSVHVKEIF